MSTTIQLPITTREITLTPNPSDEEFERMSEETEVFQLERSKDGVIIVNPPPSGLDGASAELEIGRQLSNWQRTHKRGRVVGANAGFFLPDGSSMCPDAGYITREQMQRKTPEIRRRFQYLTPAFVIELISATDSRPELEKKMQRWVDNGAELGWLIDPYKREVVVYTREAAPVFIHDSLISGTGPVSGFTLNLTDLWELYSE